MTDPIADLDTPNPCVPHFDDAIHRAPIRRVSRKSRVRMRLAALWVACLIASVAAVAAYF